EDDEMAKVQGNGAAGANGNGLPSLRLQKNQELHEVKDLEHLFAQLAGYGLGIDDYYLTQEESISGEKLMTKYALVNEDKQVEIAGVAQILPQILNLGKQ